MLKKIGLSAAAILAVVALPNPPAAKAADRDDFHSGDRDNASSTRGFIYELHQKFGFPPRSVLR